ncbi:861_t:CDS:10, partial [Diversispora eburnea]
EHIRKQLKGVPDQSRLRRLVPSVSTFHTKLPLRESFLLANAKHSIAARRFVPPSFNDIRSDGDMTLYDDGKDFEQDSELVNLLVRLLKCDLIVCVVTAAGYSGDSERYEQRLSGLLKGFQTAKLPKEILYSRRVSEKSEYQPEYIRTWSEEQIKAILNVAQENLQRCVDDMKLPCTVMRKSKAVGLVPQQNVKIFREQLDECVLSSQHRIVSFLQLSQKQNSLPFCAFNGGCDVWVDIGNKLIGVQILQEYLGATPAETLHVGDQVIIEGEDEDKVRNSYSLSAVRKYTSLFPGLGYAGGYKVLQRTYKYGGQPYVKDYLNSHYKHQFYSTFGEKSEVVLLPLDVLKILQQTNPDALKGRNIFRIFWDEGSRLYRGGLWTMARNAPGTVVKEHIFALQDYSKATFFQNFCASIGGAVASISISQPLDVVKTRIQNKPFDSPESGLQVIRNMVLKEGVTPKLMIVGPKLVFSFTVAQQLIPILNKLFMKEVANPNTL